jgi:dihydropteroate synthase
MLRLPRDRVLKPRRRPAVMGILNITPDSFSDGGAYLEPAAALDRALQMLDEGADVIDVGAESTRPGSAPVADDEQIRRAIPVIEGLRARCPDAVISIDTQSAAVAARSLAAGADIVNDVSALRRDEAMAATIVTHDAAVILMHMQGEPATMQQNPRYGDVVREVSAFLIARVAAAEALGIGRDRIMIDPGIGFGKNAAHNVTLLRELEVLVATGVPVLVGASRKRFLDAWSAGAPTGSPASRLGGSLAVVARARAAGVAMVRVHDVAETCQLLAGLDALESPRCAR